MRQRDFMRIIHIWDQAGVAYILAKYQRLLGHEAAVIKAIDQDKYGIDAFYKKYLRNANTQDFLDKCFEEAKLSDIVHIHSRIDVLFKLRERFLISGKKIILHYHGTDIRGINNSKVQTPLQLSFASIMQRSKKSLAMKLWKSYYYSKKMKLHNEAWKIANTVVVSTPDLLHLAPNSIFLPNPVDTDHFKVDLNLPRQQKNGLTMDTEVTDIKKTLHYCKKNKIDFAIDVYDRTKKPVMYEDMPDFLKAYKVYVDIRYVNGKILKNFSKTALEALACGLEVLDYQLKYRKGLPPEHDPMKVSSQLLDIYRKAL